ncbi:hypothetical protein V8E55_006510 [Tylopilus felleus]
MSTSVATPTIIDGGPTASSPGSSSSHTNSNTATLYLFTFLATILILVLLSASLVFRSYILRRRYRQRFQEALTDGLFADLDGYPRSTRRLGPKPVVWDTWIQLDKDATWSSITPVAVRCSPVLSLSSTMMASCHRSATQPDSLPSRPPLFTQFCIQSPFSLSPRPQGQSPIASPIPTTTPDTSDLSEKDAATLSICVLIAMPDAAAPVHRLAPDAKGKGVDPASPTHPQSGDADPLLPSSRRRSAPPISECALEGERLPLLEFGVVDVTMGEWVEDMSR